MLFLVCTIIIIFGAFYVFTEKKDLWRPEKVGKSLWPFLSSLFLPGLLGGWEAVVSPAALLTSCFSRIGWEPMGGT